MAFEKERQKGVEARTLTISNEGEVTQFLEAHFLMSQGFFEDTLPQMTRALLTTLQGKSLDWMSGFYLSGGTALSLQLGHRESEDLDFFVREGLILSFYNKNLRRTVG